MPPFSSPLRDRAALFADLKAKRPLRPTVNLLTGEPLNAAAPRGAATTEVSGLDAETRQANGRLARQIARRTPNREAFTDLLPILDTALQDDPQQAGLEIGDLVDQLAEQSPGHAQQLAQAVSGLGSKDADARRRELAFERPPQEDPALGAWSSDHATRRHEVLAGMPIPKWKDQLKGVKHHWGNWGLTLDRDPRITPAIRRAFLETFAAEGGLAPDDQSMAGITPAALDEVRDKLGLDSSVMPKDLTIEQIHEAYWVFMSQEHYLGGEGFGGLKSFEDFYDHEAAATLFDTLYRHGSGKGPEIVQRAMNQLLSEPIAVDRVFGSESTAAYKELIRNLETRLQLLINIGKGRYADKPKERARAIHFMFLPPGVEPLI
ncbi:MAG: hypothetical protein WD489_10410 [Rhodovibrionaceae bacterium]